MFSRLMQVLSITLLLQALNNLFMEMKGHLLFREIHLVMEVISTDMERQFIVIVNIYSAKTIPFLN